VKPNRLVCLLCLCLTLVVLLPAGSFAVQLRVKCGTVTADSCNDWYYTAGLNGAPHVPAGNAADYYLGYTGSFARRYVVNFPSIGIPQNATIDSGYLKACWVTTDSTIKPIIYMYGVASDAIDTIVDSARWVTGYSARTAAVDSMYDSLWARSTTMFGWAKTFNIKNILQELVNSGWWQSGDTAVFVAIPKSGTTGDRYFKQLNSSGGGDSLIVFYTPPSGGGSGSGPRVLIRK
jgi:hypothetical protein